MLELNCRSLFHEDREMCEVRLPGVSVGHMKKAVKLMYTGRVKISKREKEQEHVVWHIHQIINVLFQVDASLKFDPSWLVPPPSQTNQDDPGDDGSGNNNGSNDNNNERSANERGDSRRVRTETTGHSSGGWSEAEGSRQHKPSPAQNTLDDSKATNDKDDNKKNVQISRVTEEDFADDWRVPTPDINDLLEDDEDDQDTDLNETSCDPDEVGFSAPDTTEENDKDRSTDVIRGEKRKSESVDNLDASKMPRKSHQMVDSNVASRDILKAAVEAIHQEPPSSVDYERPKKSQRLLAHKTKAAAAGHHEPTSSIKKEPTSVVKDDRTSIVKKERTSVIKAELKKSQRLLARKTKSPSVVDEEAKKPVVYARKSKASSLDSESAMASPQSPGVSRPGGSVRKHHHIPWTVSGLMRPDTLKNINKSPGVVHICNICDVKFEQLKSLKIHMGRSHNEKAKFPCPENCGKMLTSANAIKKHLLSHRPEEEWPYECPLCHKKFQARGDIPKHLMTKLHENDNIPAMGSKAWHDLIYHDDPNYNYVSHKRKLAKMKASGMQPHQQDDTGNESTDSLPSVPHLPGLDENNILQ